MNSPTLHGLGGVALAFGFIKGTRAITATESRLTDALFLSSIKSPNDRFAVHWADSIWMAALVYVLLSLRQDKAHVTWTQVKAMGMYGIPAVLGRMQVSPGPAFWAGLGWLAHPFWDAQFHNDEDAMHWVPHFYPMMCLTFDVVMSGYLFNMWYHGG